jgi:hypothetical protein
MRIQTFEVTEVQCSEISDLSPKNQKNYPKRVMMHGGWAFDVFQDKYSA